MPSRTPEKFAGSAANVERIEPRRFSTTVTIQSARYGTVEAFGDDLRKIRGRGTVTDDNLVSQSKD